jgi:peptidoglycan/xylan/chitin deacetylase (PgdA/CDA1 family)
MIPVSVTRRLARYQARRLADIPNDFVPTVSFTFDDVPATAFENALPLLNDRGYAATWYVAADLLDRENEGGRILSSDQVAALHAGGHEIGSHGLAHRDAARLRRAEFERDIADNDAALQAITGKRPTAFSFPFGSASPIAKRVAMERMTSARGISPGIARHRVDLALLPANAVYMNADPYARLTALLQTLQADGGWAILYTHDVSAAPSPWGCTSELFAHLVALVGSLGFRVKTVGAVVEQLVALKP